MLNEINIDNNIQRNEFPICYKRVKTIVDPYDYCNMIADKINAKPNIWKYFFSDTKIFIIICFYSWNHHYFRLNDKCINKVKIAYKNMIDTVRTSDILIGVNLFVISLMNILVILYNLILYKSGTVTQNLPLVFTSLLIQIFALIRVFYESQLPHSCLAWIYTRLQA